MATTLLTFYGIFLILCGVVSVLLIGMKAKTALASGGISGAAALALGTMISHDINAARWGGLILPALLFIVFAWRSAKTLFKIFEFLPAAHPDLNGKGIAFLIISLMAVVSMTVFILQLVQFA